MARNVIAVIMGLVVAFLVVLGVQSINYMLYPIPSGIDPNNTEQMLEYIDQLPATAFVIVLLAHFFGSLFGAWCASMVASSHQFRISIGLALFLLVMGLLNIVQVPQPLWFIITDLFTYIPGAIIGYRLFKRFNN